MISPDFIRNTHYSRIEVQPEFLGMVISVGGAFICVDLFTNVTCSFSACYHADVPG